MESLRQQPIAGVAELSPGVRSLQIRYDSRVIHQRDLITALRERETQLPPSSQIKIPSRVVHLPLAFEDSATLDAVARYRQSVRDTAPWLPNNVDFIQRINGLESRDQVEQILFGCPLHGPGVRGCLSGSTLCSTGRSSPPSADLQI